jgi:predicted Fe-S protein YdhL (DUF1289 family)
MSQTRPTSPCINICALDEQGYCLGCYRTLSEIAGWTRFSAQEQWAIVHGLAARAGLVEENSKLVGESK